MAPEKPPARAQPPSRNQVGLPVLLLLVCALSLLSFALLLFHIDAQSLWWDEALSFHRANGSISYVLSNQVRVRDVVTTDQHPPLYFLLLHFALRLFGASEFALRFPSAAASLLLVPVSYQLGRVWFSRQVGLGAALLSAVSPYLVAYGQEARPYAHAALLGAVSLYLVRKALDTGSRRWYLAYSMIALVALFTHYLVAVLLALEVALVAGHLVWRRRRLLLIVVPLAALALPLWGYLSQRYHAMLVEKAQYSPVDMLREVVIAFSLGPAAANQSQWVPYVVGLSLLLAVGAWASRQARFGLALPAGLGAAMLIFYLLGPLPATTRYVAPLAPVYFVLLGLATSWFSWRRWAMALVIAGLVAVSAIGMHHYFFVRNDMKQDFRGLASYLNRYSLPGDVALLTSATAAPAFDYYRLDSLPLYGFPEPSGAYHQGSAEATLADIATSYRRVWWIRAMAREDRAARTQAMLDQRFSILEEKRFPGDDPNIELRLRLYLTGPRAVEAPPPHATRLGVTFGDALTAEAFTVAWADARQSRLGVTLYWKAVQDNPRRVSVWAQLVDSQNQAWGASDAEPFAGLYPTSRWRQGELLADQIWLEVTPGAPPGRYRLRLGVHELGEGPTLEARDSAGQPLGQALEIGDISLTVPSVSERQQQLAGIVKRGSFGDKLGLLQVGKVLERRRAGETLSQRLWWEVYRAPGPAEAWLRLLDQHSSVVAEARQPLSGLYPSEQWEPGHLVGADYSLRVPMELPAGTYRLLLSVAETGASRLLPVREGWWPFGVEWLDLGTVEVEQAPMDTSLPAEAAPLGQQFGQGIELAALAAGDGWQILRENDGGIALLPSAPEPASLPVILYWRAHQPVNDDYTVTVQLLDGSGRLVDQHDGLPAAGARPTGGWRPGEVIADGHVLSRLASLPAGDYTLVVGLYRQPGLERLLTVEGQDHGRLARVRLSTKERE